MHYLSLLLLFFLNTSANANDTCDRLPEYTCSDATLNDGTGAMVRNDPSARRALEIEEESQQRLAASFQRALLSRENPVSDYDIQAALSATGLTISTGCSQKRPDPNDTRVTFACARVLAASLARRASVNIFQSNTGYGRIGQGNLADENILQNSSFFRTIANQEIERLDESRDSQELNGRVERMFSESKDIMNDIIDRKVTDEREKRILKAKINSISFGGTDCTREGGAYDVDSVFMRNALYDSERNEFKYCRGKSDFGTSDYALLRTITHELTHSIDPCRIQQGPSTLSFSYETNNPESEYPFQVLSCLRSEGSIQAVDPTQIRDIRTPRNINLGGGGFQPPPRWEPEPNPSPRGLYRPINEYFSGRDSNDRRQQGPPFCGGEDQINESFCDWMGTEVLAEFMSKNRSGATQQQHIDGIAGVWRAYCDDRSGLGSSRLGRGGSSHPALRDRLTHITLAHPRIRRLIGCSSLNDQSEVKYCGHIVGAGRIEDPSPSSNGIGEESVDNN